MDFKQLLKKKLDSGEGPKRSAPKYKLMGLELSVEDKKKVSAIAKASKELERQFSVIFDSLFAGDVSEAIFESVNGGFMMSLANFLDDVSMAWNPKEDIFKFQNRADFFQRMVGTIVRSVGFSLNKGFWGAYRESVMDGDEKKLMINLYSKAGQRFVEVGNFILDQEYATIHLVDAGPEKIHAIDLSICKDESKLGKRVQLFGPAGPFQLVSAITKSFPAHGYGKNAESLMGPSFGMIITLERKMAELEAEKWRAWKAKNAKRESVDSSDDEVPETRKRRKRRK